ncbi:hypothetical protein [Burkholderia ubonensis]|uniref:hypothetical protein n=1 Tax=Burkholderia ubonensis TaxID=101571 RepID=UPI000AA7BB48|nr:hypothetical protein [Burkholderia ubonensis]
MNKKFQALSLVCSVAIWATVGNASAAGTATFGITGVITPNSCDITLGGGGIANYGTHLKTAVQNFATSTGAGGVPVYVLSSIGAGTISGASPTIPVAIVCSAPTKAELSFVDNNSAQRFGGDALAYGVADGTSSVPVGSYLVGFANASLDGVTAAGYLTAPNGSTAWSTTGPTGQSASFVAPGYTVGFIKAVANTTPDTFTNMSGNLYTQLFVSKNYVDAATNTIQLNGTGTVTLVYL